jgi:acyl-CoA synthetase (NDP forming)
MTDGERVATAPEGAAAAAPDSAVARETGRALVQAALAAGRTALTEPESKALLAAYGVAVPPGELVTSEAAAVAAARRLGGKLALKAVGSGILHKTEGGLVALGVSGDDDVAATYRALRERAGDLGEGVLLERMVAGGRELLAGFKRDPAYGPVVAFGLGGVLTEVLADVALALAPLDQAGALELLDLIRSRPLLGAFRGAPPVDRAALAGVLAALSRIAIDLPEVAEIDVNPLLIAGDRPVAVDALILLSREPAADPVVRSFVPDLRPVFSPASVAIVGASDDVRKWGGSALRNLLEGGYAGRVYPVNPRGGTMFGLQAYASVDELPEAPDLVLVVVAGERVKETLQACARRQARAVIVITAGYAETGAAGAEAERELARIATAANITLIGPNCVGILSNANDLKVTGFIVMHPPLAKLSFVSQSGSIGPVVVGACELRGIGIDKFISVGNQAAVSAIDVLDYLRDDPGTACVMLYLEGIADGRHFFEVARRTTARKPVVVLRAGRTESGSRAAASHTAAMAGSTAVFSAAARQAGVVTCETTDDLVDLGACFAYLPLPHGRRVAVVTNGGGPGVLAADEVALNGLTLAELPADLVAAIDELLPPFWSRRNPLDLVASGLGDVGLRVLELLAECDAVDAIMAVTYLGVPALREAGEERSYGQYYGFSAREESYLRRVVALMEATGKPIVNVPDQPVRGSILAYAERYAPVVLSSPRAAARALDRMAWYAEHRSRALKPRGGTIS